jgi:hypothetical protein
MEDIFSDMQGAAELNARHSEGSEESAYLNQIHTPKESHSRLTGFGPKNDSGLPNVEVKPQSYGQR